MQSLKNYSMKPSHLGTSETKKEPSALFLFFIVFLFLFAGAYSLFDAIREADFLSREKYEQKDIDDVYAEKQSSPDAALVSPALFSALPDILFRFLVSYSTPNTLFPETFSVLRC